MLLLNPLRLPILLTMFLSARASPQANPDSNPGITISPSYSLHHLPRGLKRNIPSTSHRFKMGPYKVLILKSIALMPVITAAEEMQDFFTVVSQAGSIQKLAGRVTDHYDFGFGAIKMLFNTLAAAPNQALPPLNWDLVMWIGSQLLQMTNLGWTDHFAALFVDPATNVQTLVTLQVVSAGLATIGYVNPETGQPFVPAINYFQANR